MFPKSTQKVKLLGFLPVLKKPRCNRANLETRTEKVDSPGCALLASAAIDSLGFGNEGQSRRCCILFTSLASKVPVPALVAFHSPVLNLNEFRFGREAHGCGEDDRRLNYLATNGIQN